MATKYYIEYEHGVPEVGDMLIWDGDEWKALKGGYGALPNPSGAFPPASIWNTANGLKRTLLYEIEDGFELEIKPVVNGMSGDLVFTRDVSGGGVVNPTTITLTAKDADDAAVDVYGNGSLFALSNGIYHICWVYDGGVLTYNIAKYDDTF